MTIEEIAAKKQEEIRVSKLTPEQVEAENKQKQLKTEEGSSNEDNSQDKTNDENADGADTKPKEDHEEKPKEKELPKVEDKKLEIPEAVKKRKEELQKSIDKLVSEKKALENEVKEKKSTDEQMVELLETIESLKAEVTSLKTEKSIETEREAQPDPEELAEQYVAKNSEKYLKEDAKLPREKRREMTKDELEEFLLDDYASAQRWLVKNELRHKEERQEFLNGVHQRINQDEISKKQMAHVPTLLKAFPELEQANKKIKSLIAQGYELAEAEEIASAEFDDYRLLKEVMETDDKYKSAVDAPLLTMKEMKKRRLSSSQETKKPDIDSDDEENIRQEAAEIERQRQAKIDAGINSTRNKQIANTEENLDKALEKTLAMAKKFGITKEQYLARKAKRVELGFDQPAVK